MKIATRQRLIIALLFMLGIALLFGETIYNYAKGFVMPQISFKTIMNYIKEIGGVALLIIGLIKGTKEIKSSRKKK